jgi:hypothetical protein
VILTEQEVSRELPLCVTVVRRRVSEGEEADRESRQQPETVAVAGKRRQWEEEYARMVGTEEGGIGHTRGMEDTAPEE